MPEFVWRADPIVGHIQMRLFGRPIIGEQNRRITKALHSPDDHNVRFEAASALGDIGDSNCVGSLISAIDDDQRVKEVAIRSLGKIGDPRAIYHLQEALQDDNWEIRRMPPNPSGKLETHGQTRP